MQYSLNTPRARWVRRIWGYQACRVRILWSACVTPRPESRNSQSAAGWLLLFWPFPWEPFMLECCAFFWRDPGMEGTDAQAAIAHPRLRGPCHDARRAARTGHDTQRLVVGRPPDDGGSRKRVLGR